MKGAPSHLLQQGEPGRRPSNAIAPKIMVCVTEDWFALSHFKPLLRALVSFARDVVVVTRSSGRVAELEAIGVRVVDLDYMRASTNPLKVWQTARRLRSLIASEAPDAIHLIALKPIVTGRFAIPGASRPAVAVHLTGLGLLATADEPRAKIVRRIALRAVRRTLEHRNTWLFVENVDDLDTAAAGIDLPPQRVTILGGAGVDPDYFTAQPPPHNAPPVAAFVGRMIRSKGIDTLVDAARILHARGVALHIDLYGKIDTGNPEAFTEPQLRSWEAEGLVRWHGHADDIKAIWRKSDIFVMAPRGGEGMPRAMLEAAASGRPLVVTDVPGCRHFVRDNGEGRVVPPADPLALANALAALASDGAARETMGTSARARVVAGFTEKHVEAAIKASYQTLLAL